MELADWADNRALTPTASAATGILGDDIRQRTEVQVSSA